MASSPTPEERALVELRAQLCDRCAEDERGYLPAILKEAADAARREDEAGLRKFLRTIRERLRGRVGQHTLQQIANSIDMVLLARTEQGGPSRGGGAA